MDEDEDEWQDASLSDDDDDDLIAELEADMEIETVPKPVSKPDPLPMPLPPAPDTLFYPPLGKSFADMAAEKKILMEKRFIRKHKNAKFDASTIYGEINEVKKLLRDRRQLGHGNRRVRNEYTF